MKWDNLKKWILSQNQENIPLVEKKQKIVTMQVFNKRGIHFRPATLVCKICKRYLCAGTFCEILREDDIWVYPVHGIEELLKMEIGFQERTTILCIGVLCDNLSTEVEQAIKRLSLI